MTSATESSDDNKGDSKEPNVEDMDNLFDVYESAEPVKTPEEVKAENNETEAAEQEAREADAVEGELVEPEANLIEEEAPAPNADPANNFIIDIEAEAEARPMRECNPPVRFNPETGVAAV